MTTKLKKPSLKEENLALKKSLESTLAELLSAAQKFDALERAHQSEVKALTDELGAQVLKYEDSHARSVSLSADRDGYLALSTHFEKKYKLELKNKLECGFRRAQHDPNYAVIRELLHAGTDVSKVDFMALGKKHPEATIFGLTLIAEELGFRLTWNDALKKAAEKSKPHNWQTWLATYPLFNREDFLKGIEEESLKELHKAMDKEVIDDAMTFEVSLKERKTPR